MSSQGTLRQLDKFNHKRGIPSNYSGEFGGEFGSEYYAQQRKEAREKADRKERKRLNDIAAHKQALVNWEYTKKDRVATGSHLVPKWCQSDQTVNTYKADPETGELWVEKNHAHGKKF